MRRWPSSAERILEVNDGVDVHISVGGALPGWRSYEDALAESGRAPPISDGSEMLYSSGTTGRPKAVRRPLPDGRPGIVGAEGAGVLAGAALRHDAVERVPVAGAALPRRGHQLHDGGPSGGCRLDPDAQVRRRGGAAADRGAPRHPRPVRADHVRADAQAARGRPRASTTSRACSASSTPPRRARWTSSIG